MAGEKEESSCAESGGVKALQSSKVKRLVKEYIKTRSENAALDLNGQALKRRGSGGRRRVPWVHLRQRVRTIQQAPQRCGAQRS